jgi:ABC-type transport system substrate-binding protein
VVKTVEVPGETIVVEKQVPVEVVVTKEVPVHITRTVEVPGPERVMVKEVPGKKYVTDPVTGRVFTAPEYGGTITFAKQNDYNERGIDLYARGNRGMTSPIIEKMSKANWALDRNLYSFNTGFVTPVFALTNGLAESWELTDDRTFVFKVRQGAKWHNNAPMNGRAVTADDLAFTYHRWIGNKLAGTEFSEADPSSAVGALGAFPWDSIVATDDSTLVMKMTQPAPFIALQWILDTNGFGIQAPEIIREKGGIKDWRDLIGTGPFEMKEWTFGENFTYEKNPDYWDVDRKYPENATPYIDTLRGLVIVEGATRLAGIRSGKLDYMGHPGSSQIQSIDQALSLARTNPELLQYEWSNRSNNSFNLNKSRPPFDNIDVRRAMQMALDLPTMTAAYFSGYADTTPRGNLDIQWAKSGYTTPFDEWPEDLQGYYTYNPEAAGALLDEAGYEKDENGVRFKAEFSHFARWPVAWSEFAVSYWTAIGIDIDMITPSQAEHNAARRAGNFDIVPLPSSNKGNPISNMIRFYSTSPWNPTIGHPDYDAWWERIQVSTDADEIRDLIKKLDWMVIEQSWLVWGSISPLFNITQPWIQGYGGEGIMGAGMNHAVFQYLWVDSQLKTGMGH